MIFVTILQTEILAFGSLSEGNLLLKASPGLHSETQFQTRKDKQVNKQLKTVHLL